MPTSPPPSARSAFVTGLAWTSIVTGVLMAASTGLQAAFLLVWLPTEVRQEILADPQVSASLLGTLLRHGETFLASMAALSALALGSGIGLLNRRAWGRDLTVLLLLIGMAANLAGLAAQELGWLSMPLPSASELQVPPEQLQAALVSMRLMSAVLALSFTALFGWFIHKLRSPGITAEFSPASTA